MNKSDNNPYTRDSIDLIPSKQGGRRDSQGRKWSRILEYMRKNPKVLMKAIPSPRAEEKIKEALSPPKYIALNERIKKVGKTGIPPIENKRNVFKNISHSEKEKS